MKLHSQTSQRSQGGSSPAIQSARDTSSYRSTPAGSQSGTGAHNLDIKLDYRFSVSIEQIERFDERGRLLHVHPGALARALDAEVRTAIVGPLVSEVMAGLGVRSRDVRAYRDPPGLNVRVSVEVAGATESPSVLPGRLGDISPPSASGYATEVMAEHLVRRALPDEPGWLRSRGRGLLIRRFRVRAPPPDRRADDHRRRDQHEVLHDELALHG